MADDDGARFEDFYVAARERLVPQLAALTGSPAEAEDVVHEAFIKAMTRWRHVSTYDNPEAWVYRVAVNLARTRWRRSVRFVGRPKDQHAPAADAADRLTVVAALRTLPFDQREALVLFHIGDLSVSEIAARIDAPVGTVKARLARGRRALAAQLTDLEKVGTDG